MAERPSIFNCVLEKEFQYSYFKISTGMFPLLFGLACLFVAPLNETVSENVKKNKKAKLKIY